MNIATRKFNVDRMVFWISIACAVAGITACTLDRWEVDAAVDSCKDHGGVHHITNDGIGAYVECIDGRMYGLKRNS